jgi:hypothetical protein
MLEAIASDVVQTYGNDFQPNLVLDDVVKNNPAPSVESYLFWRYADEPTTIPKPMGVATVGKPFNFPFEFPDGREIEIFAVTKTENGEQSAVNPLDGETVRFAPNRETGTPNFSQDGAALNLQIDFIATGYSIAKFRKVQWDTVNTFDSVDIEDRTKIEGNLNQPLSPNFSITRPGPEAATLAVFVRIAHSTNNQSFGAWSVIKDAEFADNTDTGGSGGGTPPSGLFYSLRPGGVVDLDWTDGSGTNSVYRNGVLVDDASGSYTDFLTVPGYYTYDIRNADGTSDPISFYYSGYEF